MTPIGLYHPGDSPLHRCPPGPKLLVLVVALAATVRYPVYALIPTVVLYVVARIPVRLVIAQIRPLWLLLVLTFTFQLITVGDKRATEVTCLLLVSVAQAGLVTLTTRVTAMLDVIMKVVGPLRRVGIEPERVGLLLALTIRCASCRRARGTS